MHAFKFMDFPEFAINHEFQMNISEILGHHIQGWPRNLHTRFFLSIYLLKKFIMLWRFYMNITGIIIGYLSEAVLLYLLRKRLFSKSFLKHLLVVRYLHYLQNVNVKALTRLVLFECKLLKFTHKVYECVFKKSTSCHI